MNSWPDDSFRDRAERRRRVVRWLIAAAVSLAVVLGGLYVWKEYFAGPSEAETTAAISESVRRSMQESFDTEPQFKPYVMRVDEVVLVRKAGNEYDGIATVRVRGDGAHKVSVQVTASEDNHGIWKTEPGAFLFLARAQPEG